MATDIGKLQAELNKIIMTAGKFGLNGGKPAYEELKKAYAAVIEGEDTVIKALPDARKAGVTGNDIKDFLRDPTFKKIFKAFDKLVDELDKKEKICYALVHDGGTTLTDFSELEARIRKEYKDSKDKDILGLLKDIATHSKRISESANVYDYKRDKKMHFYATKFDNRVKALLELAPKSEEPAVNLPDELTDSEMKSAQKDIDKWAKEADASGKKVTSIIKAIVPFTRKGDLMVQKELGDLTKTVERMVKVRDRYKDLIAKNTKEIKRGHEAVDINAFFKRIDVAADGGKTTLNDAIKEHSVAKEKMV